MVKNGGRHGKGNKMQANEQELTAALRGGLHGRFQNAFHLLENAFEVLEDNIANSVTPAKYDDLRPLLQQVGEQLLLLRRLGEHAADAAIAPVLHQVCALQPVDLLAQLKEVCQLFGEIAVQEKFDAAAELQQTEDRQAMFTMGDSALINGLLANLLSNSLAAGGPVHITLLCAPGMFCYRDDGPGLPEDARRLLLGEGWSDRLLEQGGLGLPLIRAYALAMGWTLSVEDAPGTSVRFSLPPCVVDLDEMVMGSKAAVAEHDMHRQYFLRELQPVLSARREEEL